MRRINLIDGIQGDVGQVAVGANTEHAGFRHIMGGGGQYTAQEQETPLSNTCCERLSSNNRERWKCCRSQGNRLTLKKVR